MPDIYGRFPVEPNWPAGGYMVTNPMDDRNFSVQQFTGYPVGSVPGTNWVRGQVVRMYTPSFRPSTLGYYTYDPTDPTTWHQSQR